MRCDWNLTKTQFEVVLEYFRRIEVGLRKLQSKREEKLGLRKFLSKKAKR